MNMHGKDFSTWLKGASGPQWRGKPRKTGRKCKGHTDCGKNTLPERITVRIDAAADANYLDLATIPANGVVMAKLTVDEPKHVVTEERYNFTFKHEYYLVVEPESGKLDHKNKPAARWYWVEVDQEGVQTEPIAMTGLFRRCYPEHEAAKESDPHAAFTYCNVTNDASSTSRTPSHVRVSQLMAQIDSAENSIKGLRAPSSAQQARINQLRAMLASQFIKESTGPAWMSCSHGCCIADL